MPFARETDNEIPMDQIVNTDGSKNWILGADSDFDLADLTGIDPAATILYEWTTVDPWTNIKPGIFVVTSSSGTFKADAEAHAKVNSADEDRRLDDAEAIVTSGIPGDALFDPIPSLTAVGADFGTDVMWNQRIMEVRDAHDKGINGSGSKIWMHDTGLPTVYRYKLPTAESLVFKPGPGFTIHRFLTPTVLTGDLVVRIDDTTNHTVTFAPPAASWAPSTAYSVDDVVKNSGQIYKAITAGTSAASGGPGGSNSSGIVDGSVVWGEVTIKTHAADITTELGSAGFAYAAYSDRDDKHTYLAIVSNDTTSSGKVEILGTGGGSTQSVLDGLGFVG